MATVGRVEGIPQILVAVVPIYLLMVVGGGLRRARVLVPEMDQGLTKLVIHVLYPALILDKGLRAVVLRDLSVVVWAITVGFVVIVIGLMVALLVGRMIGLRKGTGWRSFTLTAGVQNYGYVAIPLLMVFFPENETAVLGVLFTHSLGVELGIWTLGMFILRGKPMQSPREFISGPIVAVVVGLLLVLARVDTLVEHSELVALGFDIFLNLLHWLGLAAFPVGLLLIGTVISDFLGKEPYCFRVGVGSIIVRMIVMPMVILSIARFLPVIVEFKQVLLVQAAMPSAVAPIVYARHYGANPAAAMHVVVTTSVVAIISIPVTIALGRVWLGL
ncbi:MAG: AEC family transporter [Roseibacillus sp.]|nr:AEC family transporter [Roseibacillus sp.]